MLALLYLCSAVIIQRCLVCARRYNNKQEKQLIDLYWNIRRASASRWFYYKNTMLEFQILSRADRKCLLSAEFPTRHAKSIFTVQKHSFLNGFPIAISKSWILNWISGEGKQTMHFVFVTEIRNKSVSPDNGKTIVKANEMSKLYSWDYLTTYCSMVKCRDEINTEISRGRNFGCSLLWGVFNEYIKQNVIIAVLRKTNFHLDDICQLMRNQQCKE